MRPTNTDNSGITISSTTYYSQNAEHQAGVNGKLRGELGQYTYLPENLQSWSGQAPIVSAPVITSAGNGYSTLWGGFNWTSNPTTNPELALRILSPYHQPIFNGSLDAQGNFVGDSVAYIGQAYDVAPNSSPTDIASTVWRVKLVRVSESETGVYFEVGGGASAAGNLVILNYLTYPVRQYDKINGFS